MRDRRKRVAAACRVALRLYERDRDISEALQFLASVVSTEFNALVEIVLFEPSSTGKWLVYDSNVGGSGAQVIISSSRANLPAAGSGSDAPRESVLSPSGDVVGYYQVKPLNGSEAHWDQDMLRDFASTITHILEKSSGLQQQEG